MDETWKVSYSEKPEWWDDETQPRCDECGIHCEEADEWCGGCGNCKTHCCDYSDCIEYWAFVNSFMMD